VCSILKHTVRIGLLMRMIGSMAAFMAFRLHAVMQCGSLKISKTSSELSKEANRVATCYAKKCTGDGEMGG